MHTDTQAQTHTMVFVYVSVCVCVCVHKATKRFTHTETNPIKRISGVVAEFGAVKWLAPEPATDFMCLFRLFGVPLSAMMSSKRVAAQDQDLAGFAV